METKKTVEDLNRELDEIWQDMMVATEDDMFDRLGSIMTDDTAEGPVMGVLGTIGAPFIKTVETMGELVGTKQVLLTILPDIVRLSVAVGLLVGREHQRRGYEL